MGSDLYEVRAVSRSKKNVVLDVRVIHPDSMAIPADRSFALMMLRDPAKDGDALAGEVSFDETMHKDWVKKYAAGFINAVRVTGVRGAPPPAAKKDYEHRFWKHPKQWMRGRLHITVTHPAWIAHIKPGATWSSRAFPLISHYDEHPPIAPGAGAETVDAEGAFVWVPRDVYAEDPPSGFARIPALLEVPAYAPTAYKVEEEMKTSSIDQEHLRTWIGKPVCVRHRYGADHGALAAISGEGKVAVATFDVMGAHSCSWIQRPTAIGRLRFVANRRGAKVSYDEILNNTPTTAVSAVKRGRSLEVKVRVPPGRWLPIATETDVLSLLVSRGKFKPGALSAALQQDLAVRGLELGGLARILPEIARQYVASLEIDRPPVTPRLRLDGLSHEAARKALEAPWPVATVRAQVTDKKWLEGFDLEEPLAVCGSASHAPTAPQPWSAPAAPRPAATAPPDDRAVLWTGAKVWIGERRGATWTARWGIRSKEQLRVEEYALASADAAKAAFENAVAAMLRKGYRRAPAAKKAAAIVRKRLGLELNDTSGEIAVTKVGSPCKDVLGVLFDPGDRVTGVIPFDTLAARPGEVAAQYVQTRFTVIEEIAIAIESVAAGKQVYVSFDRSGTDSGSLLVKIR